MMESLWNLVEQTAGAGGLTGRAILSKDAGCLQPAKHEAMLIEARRNRPRGRWLGREVLQWKETRQGTEALASAVEQSLDGVALMDLQARLLYVNGAFARMHGHRREDMLGLPMAALCDEAHRENHEDAVPEIPEPGVYEREIGHIRKDGTRLELHVAVSSVTDQQGEMVGTLVVARDVTALKKVEAELNAYRRKMTQVERLASLGTFSAMLAHELTQPLTVLRLSLDNSLRALQATSGAPADELMEELRAARRAVEKVVYTADQIRGFNRRNMGHTVQRVDLNTVANDVVRLLDWPARQSKITLCLQGMDQLPPVCLSNDIEQVFFALVQNAIQAADGKADHHLTIRGALHDGHIELKFADDCGGIEPEHLAHIFDPFFTTKPAPIGTGLGLSIVQQIVRKNKGQVHVVNQPGAGATFVVDLLVE